MHVDHRIAFVRGDGWMGWLVNHSYLFEVGDASENMTRTVQICSVADSDHRVFTRGYVIASLDCSGRLDAIDYFRAGHLQYGARDIRLHPTLWLRHSADN